LIFRFLGSVVVSTPLDEPLTARRATGRSFTGHRKVRLGDVDREGRLRLDALTRYTQDVSDDDTTDAGLDPTPGWVVRSTVVDEIRPAALAEQLEFVTFCSGYGARWAERRLSVTGEQGAAYEVATVWVSIDPDSGRPQRVTDQFLALYGEAAGGRQIKARQVLPRPDDDGASGEVLGDSPHRWQVRAADFDVYGHVNNAAYWAAVEEFAPRFTGPRRARMEYGAGVRDVGDATIQVGQVEGRTVLWWRTPTVDGSSIGAGPPLATAAVGERPG
jgi:acyl-ACP thioesterase